MQYAEFAEKFQIQLNPQQQEAVQTCRGPVLLLAVPGSGKTTVLITRLGYLIYGMGVDPWNILTVTYTVAAARDMKNRFFQKFGGSFSSTANFSTIHAFCAGVIRYYEQVRQVKAFSLISGEITQNCILRKLIQAQNGQYPADITVREVASKITYCKNQMLQREEIENIRLDGMDFPKLFYAYESHKRRQKQMDFDDQLEYSRRILRKNPDILAYFRERYQYIQVDEAQDTSKIQHIILQMLINKGQNIFMVGDEDQSIYGFRAAYPEALLTFGKVYPQAKILYMEKNYRSVPQIVEKAGHFIEINRKRYEKRMTASRKAEIGIPMHIIEFSDGRQQYGWLLQEAINGQEQTAVLYRNHDSILPLIDLLEKNQFSYQMREGNTSFFSSFLVQDIISILHFANRPSDAELFQTIYYKMGCAISRENMQQVLALPGSGNLLEKLCCLPGIEKWKTDKIHNLIYDLNKLKKLSSPAAISFILDDLSYRECFYQKSTDDSRLRILRAIADQNRNLDEFIRRLSQLQEIVKRSKSQSNFILSTMHGSKGLEFDRVILMDVRDGILPTLEEPMGGRQLSQEDRELLEEERRLFYVAVTRARNRIDIIKCIREYGTPVRGFTFLNQLMREPEPEKRSWYKKRPEYGGNKRLGQQEEYLPGISVYHTIFGGGMILSRDRDKLIIQFTGEKQNRQLQLSVCLKGCLLYIEVN